MNELLWKSRWGNEKYRRKYLFLIFLTVILLASMPTGFDFIQSRGGLNWNDAFLNILPVYDLSWPIFVIMYSLGILVIMRVIKNPHLLYQILKAYIIITLFRFVLIYFIPLDPPTAMIELRDPINKIFYGGKIITRDLFFSGHTSSMFLLYLILEKKSDKLLGLIVTIVIGLALLVQHVHYTADVLAAIPITWIIWKFTKNV